MMKALTVFCGSAIGKKKDYADAAQQLSELLVGHNIELIYGGGRLGLMGYLADQMLLRGGRVTGVIPESLIQNEVAHTGLSKLHIVTSMHERKLLMSELADAFMILPGGIGSLDEFFEIFTWSKLGIHSKPIGLLNVCQFYDPLLQLVDHLVSEGFLAQQHRNLITINKDCHSLLRTLQNAHLHGRCEWNINTEELATN